MEQTKTNRTTYFDAIRILACIGVIYNHVIGWGVLGDGALASYPAHFAYQLCKMAVPLFFMVTGALLLGRVDSYQKTAGRFIRIAIALVLFTLLYYGAYCLRTGTPFNLKIGLLCAYRDQVGIIDYFWFLYRYLALLAMLPLLQRMVPQLEKRDMVYFLALSIIVCGSIYDALRFAPQIIPNWFLQIPLFSIYIGMVMMGYCIHRYVPCRRSYAIGAAVGVLALNAIAALLMFRLSRTNPAQVLDLDRCERALVVLAAGCVFYLAKCLFMKWMPSASLQKVIAGVGRLTFCTYLIHGFFIDTPQFLRNWLVEQMPVFYAERLYIQAVLLCCLAISALLTRVPLLKKLL